MNYETKGFCYKCKKNLIIIADHKQYENTFITGYLCNDCAGQTTLELDFSV